MASPQDKQPKRPVSPKRKVAAWLVIFNYAQVAIGFLVNLWLARTFGPEEYGLLSYGLVIGGICTILISFSSERTLVRDLIQGSDSHATLTASILLRGSMALLVVGSCLAWILSSDSLGSKTGPAILCSFWGASMALTPRAWLDSHYKMHIHAAITFIEKCTYVFCVVVFVLYGFQDSLAMTAASCLLFARCLGLVGEWFYAGKSFQPNFRGLTANIRFLVQQNILVLGAAVGNLLMTHANQIVLEHEQGSDQLAYYAIAIQIIMMIQLFQSQVVRLLGPRTAELTRPGESVHQMWSSLMRYMIYMLAISAAMLIPTALLAPWVIGIALSEDYLAAVAPLRILCGWSLIYGPALILNQFVLGLRLQKSFFIVTMLSGGLAIVLGQRLVPIHGVNAVAWILFGTHSLAIAAQFVMVWIESRRLKSLPVNENG